VFLLLCSRGPLEPAVGSHDTEARDVCEPMDKTPQATALRKPDLRFEQIQLYRIQRWIGQKLNEPAVGIDHA
jgi:hypothetical protein